MTTPHQAILDAIDDLECRAREYETRAQRCRESAVTLRQEYAVSAIATKPVAIAVPPAAAEPDSNAPRPRPPVPAPTGQRRQIVERLLKTAVAWTRSAEINKQLLRLGTHRLESSDTVELLASGKVERRGQAAGTEYRWISVEKDPQVVPPAPNGGSAASPKGTDGIRAKLAFVLLSDIFVDGKVYAAGDLVAELANRGGCTFDDLKQVLTDLESEGVIAVVMKGRERHYTRAPELHERIQRRLFERPFERFGAYTTAGLLTFMTDIRGVTDRELQAVLDGLVREGRVSVRTVELERQYAKLA